MDDAALKLDIFRFDPLRDAMPRYCKYRISCDGPLSVLEALSHIYSSIDRSLAFRNYYCGRGVCLACMVQLDGQPVKGCETLLYPGRLYTLEPIKDQPIIRDLAVDFGITRVDPQTKIRYNIATGTVVEIKRPEAPSVED